METKSGRKASKKGEATTPPVLKKKGKSTKAKKGKRKDHKKTFLKDGSDAATEPLPQTQKQSIDLYSAIFSGSSEEDETLDTNPIFPLPTPTAKVRTTRRKDDVESEPSKKSKSIRKKKRNIILTAADSDTDEEAKKKQDIEFVDEESDSELEIVGVGMRPYGEPYKTKKPSKVLPLPEEEIKEEVNSEEDIKPDLEEVEEDANIMDVHDDANSEAADDNVNKEELARTSIREELANLTFEELEALKQKMGLKLFNEAVFGTQKKKPLSRKKQMQLYKRETKNRPREMSSRARIPAVREVVHVKKVVRRDPRFDDSCGVLDKDIWDKNYDFLKEMEKEEVQNLRKTFKNEKNEEKRTEIKKYIQTFKNKEKDKISKEKELQKRKQERDENIKRMAEGKNPFYVKKSTQKFLDLADKYEELKSTGKLDKYLKKKRKKNLVRDKKAIPKQ